MLGDSREFRWEDRVVFLLYVYICMVRNFVKCIFRLVGLGWFEVCIFYRFLGVF